MFSLRHLRLKGAVRQNVNMRLESIIVGQSFSDYFYSFLHASPSALKIIRAIALCHSFGCSVTYFLGTPGRT